MQTWILFYFKVSRSQKQILVSWILPKKQTKLPILSTSINQDSEPVRFLEELRTPFFFEIYWPLGCGNYSREKTICRNMVCISCNIKINMAQTLQYWNLTTLGKLSSKHIRDEQILPRWINFPLFYWLVFFLPSFPIDPAASI